MKTVRISDLKKNLDKICDEVEKDKDLCYVITENNIPISMLFSWKLYRSYRETLSKKKLGLPLSKKAKKMLKKSEKDVKEGRIKKLM